jgi:hypothetical protein
MNVLSKLWGALGTLTGNLTALAETVREVNAALRQRVGLDGTDPAATPALPHQAGQEGTGNGEAPAGSVAPPQRRRKGQDAA